MKFGWHMWGDFPSSLDGSSGNPRLRITELYSEMEEVLVLSSLLFLHPRVFCKSTLSFSMSSYFLQKFVILRKINLTRNEGLPGGGDSLSTCSFMDHSFVPFIFGLIPSGGGRGALERLPYLCHILK